MDMKAVIEAQIADIQEKLKSSTLSIDQFIGYHKVMECYINVHTRNFPAKV